MLTFKTTQVVYIEVADPDQKLEHDPSRKSIITALFHYLGNENIIPIGQIGGASKKACFLIFTLEDAQKVEKWLKNNGAKKL